MLADNWLCAVWMSWLRTLRTEAVTSRRGATYTGISSPAPLPLNLTASASYAPKKKSGRTTASAVTGNVLVRRSSSCCTWLVAVPSAKLASTRYVRWLRTLSMAIRRGRQAAS